MQNDYHRMQDTCTDENQPCNEKKTNANLHSASAFAIYV